MTLVHSCCATYRTSNILATILINLTTEAPTWDGAQVWLVPASEVENSTSLFSEANVIKEKNILCRRDAEHDHTAHSGPHLLPILGHTYSMILVLSSLVDKQG